VARGAYVLADPPGGKPEVILIASGSEVILAVEAHEKLLSEGVRSRVVSMPSWDIFEHQTRDYQNSVLPPEVEARVAVEQASTFGWERYVGAKGRVIGMHTFGASAPLKELQKKFGFEPDRVVTVAKELLRGKGLRHPRKIYADKTSVSSAGNQSAMTPAQQPNHLYETKNSS